MIDRFDQWLGKKLFVPIAIRICQATGQSQYALHTYLWLFAIFYNLSHGPQEMGWFWFSLIAIMALLWVVVAALVPDTIKEGARWLRYMLVAFLILLDPLAIVTTVLSHKPVIHIALDMAKDWLIVLAEYALTIRTIPPLEAKEPEVSGKVVEQEA